MSPNNQPVYQPQVDLAGLTQQIEQLRQYVDENIRDHSHNGSSAQRIQLDIDIGGLFATVSVIPTATPMTVYDQIKIYENGGTHRLYWYDSVAQLWRYTAGT